MKIRSFICLVILTVLLNEFCLATIKIEGIIKDSQTNEAIVFANLRLMNYPIGTCSNKFGEFQLMVDDSLANEIVLVSNIGYESKEFKINEITESYFEISLNPQTIQLEEVRVLTPLTAKELLHRVIKNHSRNFPFGFCYYETFFRDLVRNDAPNADVKNCRLTEAAVNIEDFGLDSYREPKIKVHEIRNSFSFVESSNQLKGFNFTGIENPISWVYKYNNLISQHYLKELLKDKCYSKEIIGVTLYEGTPLYILEIRQRFSKILGMTMNITKGYRTHILYVSTKSWAVQAAKQLLVSPEDSLKSILQIDLTMQEFKNKYYLKMLDYEGFIPDELGKMDKDHRYTHKANLLINNIILDRKSIERIRLKNAIKPDLPLWNVEYKYNPEFWKTYNILLDKPIDPSVKKDLEQEVPLDNQFNDGGLKNSKKTIN